MGHTHTLAKPASDSARLAAYIRRTVAAAPALTDDQRHTLPALLTPNLPSGGAA